MGIYVELNDICESIIYCNDIISVGLAKDSSNNVMSCIEVYYKTDNGNSVRYHYKNIDRATDDLKHIKNAISSVKDSVIYYANRNIVINEP